MESLAAPYDPSDVSEKAAFALRYGALLKFVASVRRTKTNESPPLRQAATLDGLRLLHNALVRVGTYSGRYAGTLTTILDTEQYLHEFSPPDSLTAIHGMRERIIAAREEQIAMTQEAPESAAYHGDRAWILSVALRGYDFGLGIVGVMRLAEPSADRDSGFSVHEMTALIASQPTREAYANGVMP